MVPPVMTVGVLPPTVTVTVSTDFLPLPEVITNSPHWAFDPPYCVCCCMAQSGTPVGTVTVIWVSLQPPAVTVAGTPPMVTDPVPCVGPKPKLRSTVLVLNGAVVALGPEYP